MKTIHIDRQTNAKGENTKGWKRISCIVISECFNRPACVPKALPPILRFGGQVGRQGIQNIEFLRPGCPLTICEHDKITRREKIQLC